jgi:hypothetical protein
MSEVMRGHKISGAARAPKVSTTDRVCISDGCETKLSRYNKRDHCYAHAPTRFPRLRGRVVTDS